MKHCCEMTFPNKDVPMGWLFVCPCGYETTNQYSALSHSYESPYTREEEHDTQGLSKGCGDSGKAP